MAKAYLDQLERSKALPANEVASLRKAIRSAEKSHLKAKQVAKLSGMTSELESSAAVDEDSCRRKQDSGAGRDPEASCGVMLTNLKESGREVSPGFFIGSSQ